MAATIICAGALEYAPGRKLDDSPCTYVRLRLLVEGAKGDQLWTEDADASVPDCLDANEIAVHGINGQAARINVAATALADFEEWSGVQSADQGLRLRTFLNVLGPDGQSAFGPDDCWNTLTISGRPLNYWYGLLSSIKVAAV